MGEEWARIRDSKVLEDADGSFRTDMQMRDRYHNALSHGHIRGPWTQEEDKLLEEGHKIYGNQVFRDVVSLFYSFLVDDGCFACTNA